MYIPTSEENKFKIDYFQHIDEIINKLSYENAYFLHRELQESYLRLFDYDRPSRFPYILGYLVALRDSNVITREECDDMITVIRAKDYSFKTLNMLKEYLNYKKEKLVPSLDSDIENNKKQKNKKEEQN